MRSEKFSDLKNQTIAWRFFNKEVSSTYGEWSTDLEEHLKPHQCFHYMLLSNILHVDNYLLHA